MDELSSVVICTNCGAEQAEDYKFCSQCGKRSSTSLNKEKKRSKEFDRNLIFLAGYALLTIFLILFASLSEDTFKLLVILTVVFALIDILFSFAQPSVWKLFKFKRIWFLNSFFFI